jgi:hypothetical protein
MVANTLFDAQVAPDRLLRTKLAADVMALARGGESPLQRPSLAELMAPAGLSFALVSSGSAGAARLLALEARRQRQTTETMAAQTTPRSPSLTSSGPSRRSKMSSPTPILRTSKRTC